MANNTDEYRFGFNSDIQTDTIPAGLDERTLTTISDKKNEPEFMQQWRQNAFKIWKSKTEPHWARIHYPPINYQDIIYYAAPGTAPSLDLADPAVLATLEKLGIPKSEYEILAGGQKLSMDIVVDSASVARPPFVAELERLGIIFCSMSEAIQKHPDLIKKYLGTVVPPHDNFYAALNSAVFSDGSFCYVPEGVICPFPVSTYFRINTPNSGQFERTLIIAEKGATVSYTEGCTAPRSSQNQLHAAIVELIAHEGATINYYTVQNWYSGDKDGRGGIYNFVTKRGLCLGTESTITWTQVETGAAITWKYPSVWLVGDKSKGEFYSVATTKNFQQADTGTKMEHIGRETKSHIVSKGVSADHSHNTFRGRVRFGPNAVRSQSISNCDSLLFASPTDGQCHCSANTLPEFIMENHSSHFSHEAFTGRVSLEQIFYLMTRGLSQAEALGTIALGFCEGVVSRLPTEFSIEAKNLLEMTMSGSVG